MANEINMKFEIEAKISNHGLVLYDGKCGFCQFWVQFILDRDSSSYFLFAPLQAKWATDLHQKSLDQDFDTLLLYENKVLFEKSTAALRIAKKLKWPWKILWILFFVVLRKFKHPFFPPNPTKRGGPGRR